MTPVQFKAWRKRLRLSQKQAGAELGISQQAVCLLERGKRFDNDRPVVIPKTVQLAMIAVEIRRRLPVLWKRVLAELKLP